MKLSDKNLSAEVESLLNMGLTPEQIVDRAKEENGTSHVSQRTIYRAVNAAILPSFTADKLGIHDLRFSMLTFDNGKEFTYHHANKAAAGCEVYFAPSSPWERGTNENTNGRMRRFFPKGINMMKVTQSMLDEAVERMNNTPRKCLCYKTTAGVMLGLKSSFCRAFLRQ